MYTKYIGILIFVIAFGGVGYYIYKDFFGAPSGDTTSLSKNKTDVDVAEKGDGSEDMISDSVADATGSPDESVESIPAPNLDRFVINANVTDAKRSALEKTLRELSTQLATEGKYAQWLELASYRKVSEDYDGAREIWEYMTKRWPGERAPYMNLGNLYQFYLPDFPRAEEYMLATLERGEPMANDYIAFFELYTLSYKEKADKADDILLQGLEKLPNNPEISFTLAEYYASKGESVKAKTHYDVVLKFAQSTGDTALEERILAAIAKL